jgi:hypothetical protein
VKSAVADGDRDGLTNWSEFRGHTDPRRADSDRDGTPDGSEDRDADGLDNASEQRAGTNPGTRDSDHDGRPDAREDADRDGLANLAEQRTANDPGDPDSDDDGIADGAENAGRVVSFDGDVLVLRLAATGRQVSGTIDGATTLQCAADDAYERDYDDAGDEAATDDDTDSATDTSDGSIDDNASASSDDGPVPDDGPLTAASVADDGEEEACDADVLEPGTWIHEAELTTDADGADVFDAVLLVSG